MSSPGTICYINCYTGEASLRLITFIAALEISQTGADLRSLWMWPSIVILYDLPNFGDFLVK